MHILSHFIDSLFWRQFIFLVFYALLPKKCRKWGNFKIEIWSNYWFSFSIPLENCNNLSYIIISCNSFGWRIGKCNEVECYFTRVPFWQWHHSDNLFGLLFRTFIPNAWYLQMWDMKLFSNFHHSRAWDNLLLASNPNYFFISITLTRRVVDF